MKSEKLLEAIGMVDSDLVVRSDFAERNNKSRRMGWISSIAAVLVIVIASGLIFNNGWNMVREYSQSHDCENFQPISLAPFAVSVSKYPERVQYPTNDNNIDYEKWREDWLKRKDYFGAADNLDAFFETIAEKLLSTYEDDNLVFSPLNIYMALAMIAETSKDNTRQQILDLVGAQSIECLRNQANKIWNANYQNDGVTTSILANSLWLSKNYEYNAQVVDTLVKEYYASAFSGEMGSEDYNNALRTWINEQTGNLLSDYVNSIELSPDTILSLVSTVYYNDQWISEFKELDTYNDTFHTPVGEVEVQFMHKTENSVSFYRGGKFTSISKEFEGGGEMMFVLPDSNYSVEDLVNDKETLSFALRSQYEGGENLKINLSVPKFDVNSTLDLRDALESMGIKDCFDSGVSQLSVTSDESAKAYINDIKHSARVKIDEEGVEAAAVVIAMYGSGAFPNKEIDFTLDKPFLFVIKNSEGLPLFVGIVNYP